MNQPRGVLLSLAVLMAWATVGSAQETSAPATDKKTEPAKAAAPSEPLRFSEEVDVATETPGTATDTTVLKLPLPLQTTPASVSLVPAALLTEQDAVVLSDALKNAPGLNVAPGFGTFDFFTIRGFDSLSSGLVLTDGASEPESTFYPTYNLKRVEVVRGPAAFLYGSNPLAGAVNLVRKQPTSGRYVDVTVGYGRFSSLEGAIDANVMSSDGHLALRLNGLYQQTDGYRDGRGGGFRACNPAVTWKPNDDTRLTLNVEYVRADFAPDSGIPVLGDTLATVPRTQSYQSPLDSATQDLYRYRLDFERKVNDRVSFRDKVYYTDLKWDSNGSLINGAFPSPIGFLVARSLVLLDDHQKFFGNQAETAVTFRTGRLAHTLLGGFDVSRQDDRFTQDVAFLPLITLDNPVDTTPSSVPTVPQLGQKGDSRSWIFAPYVADRIVFSSKLQATVGGRFDTLSYDDPTNATHRDANKLSPLAGLVYSPVPSVSLYANAGTAFAPPSTQVYGARDPETSRQLEAGTKVSFLANKARAAVAVYDVKRENIAIPDTSGVLREDGDQRSRGVEADLEVDLPRDFSATLAYAWNDSELTRFAESVQIALDPPAFATVDRSGNTPPFAPRQILNLWASKRIGYGLRLGVGARYVSEQFIAADNAFTIAGYFLLDAMASYTHGRITATLNLKNLTNRDYETRGFSGYSAIPGNPFAAYGRVAVALGSRN
jgi:iron complex outermembrane receptor protein